MLTTSALTLLRVRCCGPHHVLAKERAGLVHDRGNYAGVRGGEMLISDGPFAETKEQVAGFNVLECADLDEAIEVASRHPTAKIGTFELRPFWEL